MNKISSISLFSSSASIILHLVLECLLQAFGSIVLVCSTCIFPKRQECLWAPTHQWLSLSSHPLLPHPPLAFSRRSHPHLKPSGNDISLSMPLTNRRTTLRASQSDDDVIVGHSSALEVDQTAKRLKDDIKKGAETIREVRKSAQRPWWRSGRFLFPLGMLGELFI
jgi:hypothetical protein